LIRASYINENDEFNIDILKNMLKDKFSGIDYEEAKKDVVPFTANKESLNIWSKEFFISITDKLESN